MNTDEKDEHILHKVRCHILYDIYGINQDNVPDVFKADINQFLNDVFVPLMPRVKGLKNKDKVFCNSSIIWDTAQELYEIHFKYKSNDKLFEILGDNIHSRLLKLICDIDERESYKRFITVIRKMESKDENKSKEHNQCEQ